MTADQLSIGGLVIGLGTLVLMVWYWWSRQNHDMHLLLPFGVALCVGALWTACAGGLLGGTGGLVATAANATGGGAITGGTGTEAGMVAAGYMQPLTGGGAIVTVILTVLWAAMIKAGNKDAKVKLLGGALIGSSLTLTAGVASLADASVLPIANSVGDWLIALFEGWA